MASLRINARRVIRDPRMLCAYARWCFAAVARRQPKLRISNDVRLQHWLSFSEYWSFVKSINQAEFALARRMLTEFGAHAVAIDVGSNIGSFSCVLGSMASVVHCFEPVPETFCRLRRNVIANRLLHRCRLNCLAVGETPGTVPLVIQEDSPATNRVSRGKGTEAANGVTVGVTTLDDYCSANHIERVQFLKIDVEGAEPLILRGARQLLLERRVAAILIEVCPPNLKALEFKGEDIWRELDLIDYSVHRVKADGNVSLPLSHSDFDAVVFENLVLLPAEARR